MWVNYVEGFWKLLRDMRSIEIHDKRNEGFQEVASIQDQ